ncbi:glycosyl hydrolase family 65 protein [Bifidobacterium actinocoloniiforme DSM 22766]|uniref:Glycosyl hydrolase family 65 protein n=1 Tax=Bifidobacterium actinocoloniiforme DSM 22766 TaxID=1437605 RepID=A0A086YYE2_9BIFI|nr:HAD-IA family hydrolase [Bifidobacterium actinocoloniiforme]KFI39292.1 glycosyl hydrolase family 65 protein [Bifidobacterium actinocoloniiforme DSM 22766]
MEISQAEAVLFDLDGVLVPTVKLHRRAWKELFDQVLPEGAAPYTEQDYFAYVDGKPRYDGVAGLLKSRDIHLPWGSRDDSPDKETICGLGNRKNLVFERMLEREGIEPYPDTVDVLQHLLGAGKRLAVVSSSRNANTVLRVAGIRNFFDRVVDGNVRAEKGIKGKPAPDTYAFAAQLLEERVEDCVVVEDALSGVAAGRSGGFGLVVGVDRGAGRARLLEAGADRVVSDLIELIESGGRRSGFQDRERLDPKDYPNDPWGFEERRPPRPESATLFSVANGNIGIRGDSGGSRGLGNGTFLSGFHDTYDIKHPESAYGYARVGQVIQGVPDAAGFVLRADGAPLVEAESYSQRVDFHTGVATMTRLYRLADGARLRVAMDRMACLFDPNLVVTRLRVESPDREVKVCVDGRINVEAPGLVASDDPRKSTLIGGCGIHEVVDTAPAISLSPNQPAATDAESLVRAGLMQDSGAPTESSTSGWESHVFRANNSRLTMAMAISQWVDENEGDKNGFDGAWRRLPGRIWELTARPGSPICLVRYVAYHSYPLHPLGVRRGLAVSSAGDDAHRLLEGCAETLSQAEQSGPAALFARQRDWLDDFWERADIEIEDGHDPESDRTQQVTRWELFQLAQSTAQITNGVGAKGLSGTGYDGHYFWDTEIYILPFLIYTDPQRARLLLHFRYRMLPSARRRAATMGLNGALFPWRTINGEEGSAYFPTGTAQYHIDADIAYAVTQYCLVCGDDDYLADEGLDLLVETARMWLSLGGFQPDGRFHLYSVTGPDEYTAMVDDDFYTNQMARFNLRSACMAIQDLAQRDPKGLNRAKERLGLDKNELERFGEAAEAMFLPYAQEEGVHAQDAQFMSRPKWDFEHCPARPLLLYYHPLAIYGHKVLKQTDVVLALYLLSSWFDPEGKRADFDYYDPLTTGDSTLSAASQAIIASEVGHQDLALRYFQESLFADVMNLHDNTIDGVHLAAAGGVWSTLVCGFGGLRDTGGTHIEIDPRLPKGWKSLTYRLTIGNSRVKFKVTSHGVETERLDGPSLTLRISGQDRQV